jgi:hypothetical protein
MAAGGARAAALKSRLGEIQLNGMAQTFDTALQVLANELFDEEYAR